MALTRNAPLPHAGSSIVICAILFSNSDMLLVYSRINSVTVRELFFDND